MSDLSMSSLKVESQLDMFVSQLVDLRASKKECQDRADAYENSIRILQGKILAYLKDLGLKSFIGSSAQVTSSERTSYKLPASDEEMEDLRLYLEEKGLRRMLKPNSISFNAFAREEYEAAKEKGDPFFEIPGVGQPVVTTILMLRAGK